MRMRASVIVLAHGPEPHLLSCVAAVRGQAHEVVVVDNEANGEQLSAAASLAGVRVLSPGRNLGFAGGCNFAAGSGRR